MNAHWVCSVCQKVLVAVGSGKFKAIMEIHRKGPCGPLAGARIKSVIKKRKR